jgi:hypothetical protein
MKDEKTLLAVLGRARSLASLSDAVAKGSTPVAGRLSTVHVTQVAVIERLLRKGGVPETLFGLSSTGVFSRPAPSPPVLSPPVLPLAMLSAAEGESVREVSMADLSPAHAALIGSLLAQRIAAVTMLGGTFAPVAPSGLGGAVGVTLLESLRAAVYGFEIVATQIESAGQTLAMSTLASLRTRTAELKTLVGSAAPPSPLGYELPFPVTDKDNARRLALHLLDALLTREAAALEAAAGDPNALATLVDWLGETESISSRWGAPPAAFPGLRSP